MYNGFHKFSNHSNMSLTVHQPCELSQSSMNSVTTDRTWESWKNGK